jgi:hypothetical protein
MAQEMYKHEALLHLLESVADASPNDHDQWAANVSNAERDYFKKVQKAEGIELDYSDFIDKRSQLRETYGSESIFTEALKATNGCGREWRVKAFGYMWRMAMKSWDGEYYDDGERADVSDAEYALLTEAKRYFAITDEEDNNAIKLTKV